MSPVRWPELNTVECWSERLPSGPADFRVGDVAGAESCAVYCEVAPGGAVGWHRDGAEEVVVMVAGTLQFTVATERLTLSAGDVALVPRQVRHRADNPGREPARFVGIFAEPRVKSVFERPLLPFGETELETPSPPP